MGIPGELVWKLYAVCTGEKVRKERGEGSILEWDVGGKREIGALCGYKDLPQMPGGAFVNTFHIALLKG